MKVLVDGIQDFLKFDQIGDAVSSSTTTQSKPLGYAMSSQDSRDFFLKLGNHAWTAANHDRCTISAHTTQLTDINTLTIQHLNYLRENGVGTGPFKGLNTKEVCVRFNIPQDIRLKNPDINN